MKRMIVAEFCPREIVLRMVHELGYLTIEEANLLAYTICFEDLARICMELINSKDKKTKKYVTGLTPSLQGVVTNIQPNPYHKPKELAFTLIKDHPFKSNCRKNEGRESQG